MMSAYFGSARLLFGLLPCIHIQYFEWKSCCAFNLEDLGAVQKHWIPSTWGALGDLMLRKRRLMKFVALKLKLLVGPSMRLAPFLSDLLQAFNDGDARYVAVLMIALPTFYIWTSRTVVNLRPDAIYEYTTAILRV